MNNNSNENLKICVYAIAKNESKFVNRFMDSLEGQIDKIYILDTGSTDDTVELFRKRGAIVHKRTYKKFKFDKARNDSLKFVPLDMDVCICLDIDDIIQPGFVDIIKNNWVKGITSQMRYEYLYTFDENDVPILTFYNNHIHGRHFFKWIYPIHEVLHYEGTNFNSITNHELKIHHRPDKTKSREFYLDLLEERVNNYPDDSRNTYLLAREYLNKNRYEDSIEICKKYLKNTSFQSKPERSKIMFFLARNYRKLNQYDLGVMWAKLSIDELPKNRDPYVEALIMTYKDKKYREALDFGLRALEIKDKNPGLINDALSFNGTIEDYVSLIYYYLEEYDKSLEYVNKALEIRPDDRRLKDNKKLYENKIKESSNDNRG